MVKMEICSDSEDQISKVSDSSLIAYRIRKAGRGMFRVQRKIAKSNPGGGSGAQALPPAHKEISSAANGSSLLPAQGSCEAPTTPSSLLPESLLSSEGKLVGLTSVDHAAPNESERGQFPSKDALATNARSDGESREGRLQWTPSPTCHRDVSTPFATGAAGASGSSSQPKVPPKNSFSLPRISEFFSVVVGQGTSSENLGAAAERLVAREVLSAAKESDPSTRTDQRRRLVTSSHTPPNPTLSTHPSKGPGTIAPTGADPQGPLPIDFSLEIEAEFPQDMVTEMQGNAAKKARRMGVEALLTHMIKVQFPNLQEQFRNAKALTIMASKLGEVLDIEAADFYINRPVGPMVMVEVQDITRLARFIRIPSMAEGAPTINTIRQRILYSGLPNQCRKCHKFGHHARACNTNITRPREDPKQHNPPPSESSGEIPDPQEKEQGAARASKPKSPTRAPPNPQDKRRERVGADVPTASAPPRTLLQPASQANPQTGSLAQVPSQRRPTNNNLRDHEMLDPSEPPARLKSEIQPDEGQPTPRGSTPSIKLHFGLPRLKGVQILTLEENPNPFASPGEGIKESERLNRSQVDATEGWTFQGKRRHTPKLALPRQEAFQPLFHTSPRDATPRGKRGLMHLEVHTSFFTSFGITAPPNKEPFKARIWPVLVRDKNAQKETLVHSKNQTPPSLPLCIRITGPAIDAEVDWSPNSAWADLIQRLELELEEKILRFKLSLTD
ncbi:unnamed protein product [Sphagnum jensenii]|uniref:CCHC-type domain-containing protein n=1 Tax=Sphagnum jensenii TaxID=128206 RepID=A0ABP1B165_9BRYO